MVSPLNDKDLVSFSFSNQEQNKLGIMIFHLYTFGSSGSVSTFLSDMAVLGVAISNLKRGKKSAD